MKTTKLIAVITIIFSAYLAYAQSNINKYLKEDSERKTLVIAGDGTVKLMIGERKDTIILNFRQKEVFERLHPKLP